jgi:hypothetical protein
MRCEGAASSYDSSDTPSKGRAVLQSSDWRQQIAASIEAARVRHAEVVRALTEVVDRGRELGNEASSGAQESLAQVRARLEALPRQIVDDARERLNFLSLATRRDVELESRRNRKRLANALNELLEAERARDDRLREAVVSGVREQLESFTSALNDDAFFDVPLPADRRSAMRTREYLDELDDPDEDELLALEGVYDDEIDLTTRSELRTHPFDD